MIRSITLHTFIYVCGLIAGKGLGLIIFILFARALGPSSFGLYLLFITYVQLATFIGDFGLQQWYQKHTSDSTSDSLFMQVVMVRVVTLVICGGVLGIFLMVYPVFSYVMNAILVFTLLCEAMISLADGYYIEHTRTFILSLKNMARLCVLGILYYAIGSRLDLTYSVLLYTISAAITAAWYFPWHTVRDLKTIYARTPFKNIMQGALPYASLIVTSIVYSKGDSIAIKSLLGNAQLGIYGTAYRYLEALSIIPQALSQMLFPISAKKSGISWSDLTRIWVTFTGLGILISLTMFFMAHFLIVQLIGTAYSSAVPVVQILTLVVALFFMNAPLSAVVQSSSLIKKFLPLGISNTVLNIGLNIVLLPIYGIQAAAWTMCFTEFSGLVLNSYFIYKIYRRA